MKHHSIAPLRSIPPLRRALSAISIVLSLVLAIAAFGVPVTTSWTYQGQLRRSGAAYNGTCNFQFSLWDTVSAGAQQGSTLPINGVNVVNGLFTVTLDFGDLFFGEARWLATSVQCSGDGGFTPLDPRQSITATPYALSLRPGAIIADFDTSASRPPALTAQSFSASGGSSGLAGIASGFSAPEYAAPPLARKVPALGARRVTRPERAFTGPPPAPTRRVYSARTVAGPGSGERAPGLARQFTARTPAPDTRGGSLGRST